MYCFWILSNKLDLKAETSFDYKMLLNIKSLHLYLPILTVPLLFNIVQELSHYIFLECFNYSYSMFECEAWHPFSMLACLLVCRKNVSTPLSLTFRQTFYLSLLLDYQRKLHKSIIIFLYNQIDRQMDRLTHRNNYGLIDGYIYIHID